MKFSKAILVALFASANTAAAFAPACKCPESLVSSLYLVQRCVEDPFGGTRIRI